MNCIPIETTGLHSRSATASLEVEREHVCGFDSLRRGESGTDRFATTGKSGEVMKRDAASDEHARKLLQRAIHFDGHTAFSRSEFAEPASIVRVMLNNSQPLHDEWSQQFNSFFFSDWSMNAGRKNYRHARRRDTDLHETPDQKIYDLRTCGCTSCVGHDDQHRIIAAYNLIYRR